MVLSLYGKSHVYVSKHRRLVSAEELLLSMTISNAISFLGMLSAKDKDSTRRPCVFVLIFNL